MSTETKRSYWAELIEAWQASEQSGAAFCRERELVYSQFNYWRKQLCGEPPEATSGGGFVSMAFEETGADQRCGVRVRVSADIELVLERGFDEAELVRAARALMVC